MKRQCGNAALNILITISCLAIAAVIIIGGYQLGWWLQANQVNRSAKINRQSYEVQQTYREKVLNDISDVRSIDAQIGNPAYSSDLAQLRAQRISTVNETCDAISRLTTSGAGIDPDIQSFHDSECNV